MTLTAETPRVAMTEEGTNRSVEEANGGISGKHIGLMRIARQSLIAEGAVPDNLMHLWLRTKH